MGTAQINGIVLDYQDTGTGPALVLVHGHPFDRSMWRPQAEHFAGAGWRVIVPDLRGYGGSTVVPGRTPLDTFAADIAGLMDHLAVDRFVLGGLSMGGQIVMACQLRFPARIRALLLADTAPRADDVPARRARYAMAERLSGTGMAGYAEEVLPKMVSAATLRDRPEVAAHVLAMMRGAPAEGAAAALRGRAERPDYLESLAGVTVPTLVVVGRDDEFTPVTEAELIRDRVPGAVLAVIDGAGHLPNLERPAVFNATLARFLAGLADPAPATPAAAGGPTPTGGAAPAGGSAAGGSAAGGPPVRADGQR